MTVTAECMRCGLLLDYEDKGDRGALACASDGILTLHIQQKVVSELKMCC